jgi:hypothetical protein
MKELITTEQAARAIIILALALPIAGLVIGGIAGVVRRRSARGAALGLVCGLSGPAIWVMWRVYNGVIGRFGLDSVKGLLVNLALFVVVGLAVGVGVGAVQRRRAGSAQTR